MSINQHNELAPRIQLSQAQIAQIYQLVRKPFSEFRRLVKAAFNEDDNYFYALRDKRFKPKHPLGINPPTYFEIRCIRNIAAACMLNMVVAIEEACGYRFTLYYQRHHSEGIDVQKADLDMTFEVNKAFNEFKQRVQSEVARACGIKPQNFNKLVVEGALKLSEDQLLNAEKALLNIIIPTAEIFINRFQIPMVVKQVNQIV